MSGAFATPMPLTGGAGYKANHTYDEFLRRHSNFYRRNSAASAALEEDRRASQVSAGDAAAATEAVGGQGARKGSVAAAMNNRKGSVSVESTATRKDSVFGLEATAGTAMSEDRRPSTSLAHDLLEKFKGRKASNA